MFNFMNVDRFKKKILVDEITGLVDIYILQVRIFSVSKNVPSRLDSMYGKVPTHVMCTCIYYIFYVWIHYIWYMVTCTCLLASLVYKKFAH